MMPVVQYDRTVAIFASDFSWMVRAESYCKVTVPDTVRVAMKGCTTVGCLGFQVSYRFLLGVVWSHVHYAKSRLLIM